MNPEDQMMQDPAVQQAQMAAQAQQGLGTPPPAPYEYQENPSMQLMKTHVADQMQARAEAKEQEALAIRAKAEEAGGYAGYRGDPSAGVGGGSNGQGAWQAPSEQAHQMNIQIADRIKSGQIDIQTAQIAIQHPDVAPEIKAALGQIIQQSQTGGSPVEPQQMAAQGAPMPGGSGLGSVPLPQ